MLHFEQGRCLEFQKMDLLGLYYAVISITTSPNTPHKVLPLTVKGAQGPCKVWYPKQSLDVGSCLPSRWESRSNTLKRLCGCAQPPWITQPIISSLTIWYLTCFSPHWQGFSSTYPAKCDILRGRTEIPQTRSSFAEERISIIHQITPNIIFIHCPYRFLFKAPAVSAFSLGDSTKGSFLFIQELFLSNKGIQH